MKKSWFTAALLCFSQFPNFQGLLFAGDTESFPFDGVRYVHRHVSSPREIDMHIVIIDLNRPGVKFKTTGSNGDRDGETDLERTSEFVERCKAQIGINGGFFSRGWKERINGTCNLSSLAVSDGVLVSPWGAGQKDAVNIATDNTVTFVERASDDTAGNTTTPKIDLYNAIAGNVRLLRNGDISVKGGDPTYPQTAVGHTADHHLILFVSDGRRPEFSAGMTYEELSKVFLEFGALDAIAFDGGGSATIAMADGPDGKPKVINRPSDGSERRVGNNLVVIIDRNETNKGK